LALAYYDRLNFIWWNSNIKSRICNSTIYLYYFLMLKKILIIFNEDIELSYIDGIHYSALSNRKIAKELLKIVIN